MSLDQLVTKEILDKLDFDKVGQDIIDLLSESEWFEKTLTDSFVGDNSRLSYHFRTRIEEKIAERIIEKVSEDWINKHGQEVMSKIDLDAVVRTVFFKSAKDIVKQ